MSFLSDFFSASAGTLVKDVSEAVKPYITTEGDRLKIAAEVESKVMDFSNNLLTHADNYEAELTKRQQTDMGSDSWLSKNIRPMTVIYLLAAFTLMLISDGNLHIGATNFQVKPEYASMLQTFLEYGLMFYFGGRSLEKITSMVSGVVAKK